MSTSRLPGVRAAASFFNHAGAVRTLTNPLPPFLDGDCVICPEGHLWLRRYDQWIIPGQPDGLALDDSTITMWWDQRLCPGSHFVLVHRLRPAETSHITAEYYTTEIDVPSLEQGPYTLHEEITGAQLRYLAAQAIGCRTLTVHLELPAGIVTFHSTRLGDVVYLPAH